MSNTNANIVTWDQSTWLVHGAVTAAAIGPPKPPKQVALPGAKQAIEHDRLVAHQQAGHDQEQITARLNDRWHAEHAERLAEHKRWVAGPYVGAIEEMRRRQMEAAAEELRRKAVFEQILAEREQS